KTGPGRLFPRNHVVAAPGPAARGQTRRDCGIFRLAAGTAARKWRYSTHPADPWRQRHGDTAPGDVPGREPAGIGRRGRAVAPGARHGPWHRSRGPDDGRHLPGPGLSRTPEKPRRNTLRLQTVMTNRLSS